MSPVSPAAEHAPARGGAHRALRVRRAAHRLRGGPQRQGQGKSQLLTWQQHPAIAPELREEPRALGTAVVAARTDAVPVSLGRGHADARRREAEPLQNHQAADSARSQPDSEELRK